MIKKRISLLAYVFVIFLLSGPAFAETGRFAVSAKAGTLGLGLEGIAKVTSNINARIGANTYDYDFDGEESDIDYELTFEFLSFRLLDVHPFAGGFRITGGLLANQNEVDMKGEPSGGTYEIGNNTYPAATVGTLDGNLDFDSVAPYLGIGWGNAFNDGGNWTFSFDLGVLFQGSPDVTLTANGPVASIPLFQADLKREEKDLQDDIDDYDLYPVISFGVTYRY